MSDFTLDDSIGYNINIAANFLKKHLNQAFKSAGYDITSEQWSILNRLWEKDGINQLEIAGITLKDNASVTRTLELMDKKGLIRRQVDPDDRRNRRIYLTDAGKKLKKPLIQCAEAVLKRATANISAREIGLLNELSRQIIQNLK
ncbi:DNA-binding MarR family transcriptional regulator [Catalinimonas alkaloidigena]|uniref:MarR family winged helix-turn-helix transcriptional regulator n=1 Tax=Catalinimonas alkaloidigena TaxID=1075417 RepID=UPI0024058DD1|nr:MarR family transcriptional regulator [Catalinimonas alkaloidigena]MDF9800170.1 DNA-binding MarR family transcriptional regulator [Catalinimonas alkaloidigena]